MSDIPKLGRLKFWPKWNDKDIRFGDVSRYSEEAKESWQSRNLLIENPIDGTLMEVPIDDITYEEQPYGWEEYDPETHNFIDTEYDRYINDSQKEAEKKSVSVGKGVVKDKLFSVPVADGCAVYVVTKVNKKSVKIEWRGFHPDRWVDGTLGYGGSFPMHCIEGHVRREDGLREIFGKKG